MARGHKRLGEAVEDYLRFRQAKFAPTTVANEAYVLRRFAHQVADIQLRHLRPEAVAEWFYGPAGLMSQHQTRDGRRRPPVRASTHNFYRSRLASFFRFCSLRGWVKDDLLAEVAPAREVKRARLQPPPDKLLALLDAASNPRDRCYISVLLNTALRANEVVRLRVGDVDLTGSWLRVWISKSAQEDLMPISADLDAELRTWLTVYTTDLQRPLDREDHLLPARRGPRYQWRKLGDGTRERHQTSPSWIPGKPMSHPERVVKAALSALDLDQPGEGSHTVRRAVARAYFDSLVQESGYDAALRTVSALLHHSSSATTEHYLGLSSERRRRDASLRGQPFLTAMVSDADVIPLRRTEER